MRVGWLAFCSRCRSITRGNSSNPANWMINENRFAQHSETTLTVAWFVLCIGDESLHFTCRSKRTERRTEISSVRTLVDLVGGWLHSHPVLGPIDQLGRLSGVGLVRAACLHHLGRRCGVPAPSIGNQPQPIALLTSATDGGPWFPRYAVFCRARSDASDETWKRIVTFVVVIV